MSTAHWITADVFAGLAMLPADSVDLVFTSPPFLALRSYLPADHPDKAKEIGSEATPAAFLDALLDVVEACDRVLAPHGTLCFELGDTYAGGGGTADGDNGKPQVAGTGGPLNRGGGSVPLHVGPEWPESKSLTCIPDLFQTSLAYGANLLRPERTTPRWRVRNKVPWCRPNPPVGALGDKWRPATSYVVVACKARDRWFDLDAVRTEMRPENMTPRSYSSTSKTDQEHGQAKVHNTDGQMSNPNGAPPLDYLVLPTAPYKGAHYATFPPGLVVPFVKSMCPEQVCRTCGQPRRRIVEPTAEYASRPNTGKDFLGVGHDRGKGMAAPGRDPGRLASWSNRSAEYVTLGFTDCGHDDYRRGVVLDCFAGSGTTLAVATGHGRDAVGIDLDARNLELARERLGMFLVETPA